VPLQRIERLPFPRLLIADDTGLGKTAEAGLISHVTSLFDGRRTRWLDQCVIPDRALRVVHAYGRALIAEGRDESGKVEHSAATSGWSPSAACTAWT
jgi:hypothetical protein